MAFHCARVEPPINLNDKEKDGHNIAIRVTSSVSKMLDDDKREYWLSYHQLQQEHNILVTRPKFKGYIGTSQAEVDLMLSDLERARQERHDKTKDVIEHQISNVCGYNNNMYAKESLKELLFYVNRGDVIPYIFIATQGTKLLFLTGVVVHSSDKSPFAAFHGLYKFHAETYAQFGAENFLKSVCLELQKRHPSVTMACFKPSPCVYNCFKHIGHEYNMIYWNRTDQKLDANKVEPPMLLEYAKDLTTAPAEYRSWPDAIKPLYQLSQNTSLEQPIEHLDNTFRFVTIFIDVILKGLWLEFPEWRVKYYINEVAANNRINTNIITTEMLAEGMLVELEHGIRGDDHPTDHLTNITNNNLDMTCKIAAAHYAEGPKYYKYLKDLEKRLEKEKTGDYNIFK